MLADDHRSVRQGLRALLEAEPGIEVVDDVGDIDATVRAVHTTRPDVLVLDLSMPGAGGIAAIRPIKLTHPPTAVVVLTRHRDLAFVREALSAGAIGYVLKQSSFGELRRALAHAIRSERYIDSALSGAFEHEPLVTGRPSGRERDVLRRTAIGQSNKEIAASLGITVRTVEVHKTNGMRKLDLPDRGALVRYAVLQGWLLEP